MRKLLLFTIIMAFVGTANSQCTINAIPEALNMNCDDSIVIDFAAFADFALNNDFNNGTAGVGWQATSSAQFNNPFSPSLDNTTYLWMGDQADVPRELTSNGLDLSLGGLICFDLAYAIQSQPSPTEGPDEIDEGVSLQYSIDGGNTWIDIVYLQPDGQFLPTNPGIGGVIVTAGEQTPFTTWDNYCFDIPVGAYSSSTQIQWAQTASSSTSNDHWGLDNIEIFVADTSYDIISLNDGMVLDSTIYTAYFTTDSTFNFIYTNLNDDTCSASVDFTINPTDAGPDIIASCDGIGIPLNVTGVSPWSVVSWSPTTGLDDPSSPNPFVNPTVDQLYTVTSNCGEDDIFVDVVPAFDVTIAQPDTICIGGVADITVNTSPPSVAIASYEWTPTSTLVSASGQTVSAFPNTSTDYIVTVTSTEDCVIQDTVTVHVSNESIFLNIVNDSAVICQGDTANVQVNTTAPNPNVPYVLIDVPFDTIPRPTNPQEILPINFANGDAVFSLALPFTFEFFGNNFGNASLSSDGWLSFSPAFNSDNTPDLIPTTTGVDNMIAFAWENLDVSAGGSVIAYIHGTAPNQAFVIEFIDVPHLGSSATVSLQLVLYEGSNIIQINNVNVQSDGAANEMVQGIENLVGSAGITIPGRNLEDFTASNESWQFIPYNPPSNITYAWEPSPFLQELAQDDVNLFPQDDMYFVVNATSDNCVARDSAYVEVDLFEVLASPDTSICVGDTATLSATIAGAPLVCVEDYDINSVPIGMLPSVNATTVSLSDDALSGNINLPFSFEFYCNTYNAFRISSNGFITFDIAGTSNGCCTGQNIPNAATPNGAVGLHWNDLNPNNGGTISHWVTGTAPNRIYVVEYNGVPHFGGGGAPVVGQIHIHENGNVIEVHCESCVSDGSNATLGLESVSGIFADTPPGRNSANWSANNEAWRFVPANSLGNYDFVWSPNYNLVDTFGVTTFAYPTVDTYYTVGATNINGCTYFDSTLVSMTSGIISGNDTICEGDTTQIFASGAGEYLWAPDNGTLSDVNAQQPLAFPSTTTTYVVTFNPNSCPTQDSLEIFVNPTPNVTINDGSGVTSICNGSQTDLIASPNNPNWNYNWTGPESGTGFSFQVSTPGNYVLFVSDENNCASFANVTVNENPSAELDFTSLDNILCCTDDSTALVFDNMVVTNGVTIASFEVDGNIETEPFMIYSAGSNGSQTLSISVTTDAGCITDSEFVVETRCINPTIDDITEIFINTPETFNLTIDNGDAFLWTVDPAGEGEFLNDDVQNALYTATGQPGNYTANVVVEGNYTMNDGSTKTCVEEASDDFVAISIEEPKIPDAFSPNGDGNNEVFFDTNTLPLNTSISFFRVYNRWGEIVYDHDVDPGGWDGTFQSEDQPQDVYQYLLEVNKADGTKEQYSGTVSLLR